MADALRVSAHDRAYSVVIPAYNAEPTIVDAISSVLAQSVPPHRLYVVDDGSTDATAEYARRYGDDRIVVISQAHAGAGIATNVGMDRVTTPIIAFLDADDLWLPHKAALQLDILSQRRDVDGVFGRVSLFKHGEKPDANAPSQDNWGRTTAMIRTDRARSVGPLSELSRGEFVDWVARARDCGLQLIMLPDVVGDRRIMPGSLSDGRDHRDKDYLFAVKRALDRRRLAKHA